MAAALTAAEALAGAELARRDALAQQTNCCAAPSGAAQIVCSTLRLGNLTEYDRMTFGDMAASVV